MKKIILLFAISLIAISCTKETPTLNGQSAVLPPKPAKKVHGYGTAVLQPKKPAGVKGNGGATSARRPIGPKG